MLVTRRSGGNEEANMNTNTNQTQPQTGVLRIGRGTALHPARKDHTGVTALCGCPNTQNGFGVNAGQFFANVAPTCKRSAGWQ